MDIKKYLDSLDPDQKIQFADSVGTSLPYLSQLAHGHRQAGARIIASIERATDGKVTHKDLRPDLYPDNAA